MPVYMFNQGSDGGASGDQYTATLIVAAYNTLNPNAAHYQCDGVADDVEINAALNALPVGGGRVILLEGDYTLANSITIPDDDITLEGQGESTFIDGNNLDNLVNAIVVTGRTNIHLLDFSIRTESGSRDLCDCIYVSNGSNDLVIERVHILSSSDNGIYFTGTSISGVRIIDCDIEAADNWGILVDMSTAEALVRLHVEGCVFSDIAESAIQANASANNAAWHIIGNLVDITGGDGMDLDTVTDSVIEGNRIINADGSALYLGEGVENCIIADNILRASVYDGVTVLGPDNLIKDNQCILNGRHGILVAAVGTVVDGNRCYDNSQTQAGASDGIHIYTGEDRCVISNNYCASQSGEDQTQANGIYLESGVDEAIISDNYCYQHAASGIVLVDSCDRNIITGNYCHTNTAYGIDIASANAEDNVVKDNRLWLNVGAQIRDNGTHTRTEEVWCPVVYGEQATDADVVQIYGTRPVTVLTLSEDESAYATLQVPREFQQMLTAHWIIIPGATGNMVWTATTAYGRICANESYTQHDGSINSTTSAVIENTLECFDIAAALAAIGPEDNAGLQFTRTGSDESDTVDADCYAVGLRFRYV